MNKKKSFLIIGIFWLILIGGFIGLKEYTLQTGEEIFLKIIPVDPRDMFRGDYVVLRYDISTIDAGISGMKDSDFTVGEKVFVSMKVDKEKTGSATGISKQTPKNGVFIKGTIKNISANKLTIEYGIESYFVPEGKGREIERQSSVLNAKVAVDGSGNAVIKSLFSNGQEIVLQ